MRKCGLVQFAMIWRNQPDREHTCREFSSWIWFCFDFVWVLDFGSYCFISDVNRVIKFEPSFVCDKNEMSSCFLPKIFPFEKLPLCFSQINICIWEAIYHLSVGHLCWTDIHNFSAREPVWPQVLWIFATDAKYWNFPAVFFVLSMLIFKQGWKT